MALRDDDLAILSARFGVARFGASRFGFVPEYVEGTGTEEPGEYVWKEQKPPTTLWTLQSIYSYCGERPVASFTDSPDPSDPDEEVTFTDTSTPTEYVSYWLWDFGDGTTSNDQNPTHAYSAEGSYTVTLYISGIRGTASTTGTHTVIDSTHSTVSGTVRYDGGATPWPGVEVSMTVDAVPWAAGTATTDANGLYTFEDVTAGAIVVSVDDDAPGGGPQTGSNSGTNDPPDDLTLDIDAVGA